MLKTVKNILKKSSKIDFDFIRGIAHVLIVDDSMEIYNLLVHKAEEKDLFFEYVDSTEKAKEYLKKTKPHLILMDLKFGLEDDQGIEFTKVLKNTE